MLNPPFKARNVHQFSRFEGGVALVCIQNSGMCGLELGVLLAMPFQM